MVLNSGKNGEQNIWRKSDGQIYFMTFLVVVFFLRLIK